jgi:hypothetical protein
MRSYWSCSKFGDWLRGTPKGEAKTSEEWDQWRDDVKARNPIRYWIVEEGLDTLQKFVTLPATIFNDIRYYINNRWVTKAHALTAHPSNIKPGQWCDLSDRFLPCMFNALVDFVEVESAWMHIVWSEENRKKFATPFYSVGRLKLSFWRCPEAGIAHLTWASSLTNDWLPEDHPEFSNPSPQAKAAREILELYYWWKQVYPFRPDPYKPFEADAGWRTMSKEESAKALARVDQLEKQQEEEDTAMMKRLIDVRKALWT